VATETGSHVGRTTVADKQVVAWRREQLRAAAFPAELADALARDWRVDLHTLIELVERGCNPVLAARILAPLEESPRHDEPEPGR
jgi:hypothetical protein